MADQSPDDLKLSEELSGNVGIVVGVLESVAANPTIDPRLVLAQFPTKPDLVNMGIDTVFRLSGQGHGEFDLDALHGYPEPIGPFLEFLNALCNRAFLYEDRSPFGDGDLLELATTRTGLTEEQARRLLTMLQRVYDEARY